MPRVTATHGALEQDMPTGLIRRGARYSTRRRIPLDLKEHYRGRTEIVRALGTSDPKDAKRLHALMWVALDREFEAARGATGPKAKLTPKPDVHELSARIIQQLRSQRDDAAKRGALEDFADYQRMQLAYQQAVLDGTEPLDTSLRGHEAHRNALRALLSGDGAMALVSSPPVEKVQAEEAIALSLTDIHEGWVADRERPHSTVVGMKRAVDRFVQVVGDKPISSISRRDVIDFTDKMRTPGAVTPMGSSIPNMNTTLSLLSALFGYAIRRGLIETNPAKNAQIPDPQKAREKRREFDAAALQAIFGSPIYVAGERPAGGAGEAAYWIPLVSLYTGGRISEICQLHPDDVFEEEYSPPNGRVRKAWVVRFVVNAKRAQSLKTKGSERRIPIHADLIALGFITYVQAQATKAHLFDDLKPDPRGGLCGNWGRWWGRYLREVMGVTNKRMTFHSFRHSFKHYSRQSLIPHDVHNALTGHETGFAADDYGAFSFPLHPLVEGMKRYRVPGFKLPAAPNGLR